MKPACVYLIGSLRNPEIPKIAERLRKTTGLEIFDNWFSAGNFADDSWRDYEKARGHSYIEGLQNYSAKHVFDFDLTHLRRSSAAILVHPAGKSAHLELGWMLGQGKLGYILIDDPERWDVMALFATAVFDNIDALAARLKNDWVSSTSQAFVPLYIPPMRMTG